MKFNIVLLALAIGILSCDPVQNLEVVNQTSDTIFFELSHNSKLEMYPIQKESNGDTLWANMNFVFPKESSKMPLIGTNGWRNFINKKCTDSTLTVFFFSRDFLKSAEQDSVLMNQLYSKKLTYKVKDLEKMNWQIEYK